jgi:hypothetical protein
MCAARVRMLCNPNITTAPARNAPTTEVFVHRDLGLTDSTRSSLSFRRSVNRTGMSESGGRTNSPSDAPAGGALGLAWGRRDGGGGGVDGTARARLLLGGGGGTAPTAKMFLRAAVNFSRELTAV